MSAETSSAGSHSANLRPEHIVGVRFYPVGKVYHFDASRQPDLREGDFVVVTTSRGQQIGRVAIAGSLDTSELGGRIKPVDRRATGRDMAVRKHWDSKELEALITARALNAEVGLPIKLVKAEYSFDGRQLTFLYSAEERKDTKRLRTRLSRAFRASVELRQIGPRDVAKILGGYGACGGPRCCSTFLTEFSPISIRMAKAQGVSLSPSEITGMCGRLRCCLIYEFEQYVEARRSLPKQGKRVGTPFGEGRVVTVMPLKESALIDVGDRHVEVHREDIVPLEEWRALQEKASQRCDHGDNCSCGRKSAGGAAGSRSELPNAGPDENRSQQLPAAGVEGEAWDDDSTGGTEPAGQRNSESSAGKPPRRRRRRRKRR